MRQSWLHIEAKLSLVRFSRSIYHNSRVHQVLYEHVSVSSERRTETVLLLTWELYCHNLFPQSKLTGIVIPNYLPTKLADEALKEEPVSTKAARRLLDTERESQNR